MYIVLSSTEVPKMKKQKPLLSGAPYLSKEAGIRSKGIDSKGFDRNILLKLRERPGKAFSKK